MDKTLDFGEDKIVDDKKGTADYKNLFRFANQHILYINACCMCFEFFSRDFVVVNLLLFCLLINKFSAALFVFSFPL